MEVADGNERSKKRYVIIFLSWTRLTDLFETLWKYVLLIFINFESFFDSDHMDCIMPIILQKEACKRLRVVSNLI